MQTPISPCICKYITDRIGMLSKKTFVQFVGRVLVKASLTSSERPAYKPLSQGTAVHLLMEEMECIFSRHTLPPPKNTPSSSSATHLPPCGVRKILRSTQLFLLLSSLDSYHFSLAKLSVCTCWDSEVVRLLGSTSAGDVGMLLLESVISRARLSLAGCTHFVTRNLPTARTVTSPWWLRRASGLCANGFLMSGHFFWLQRVQMSLWLAGSPMVCRWLQVCLGAPGGAPGDMGATGLVGVPGVLGVTGDTSESMLLS